MCKGDQHPGMEEAANALEQGNHLQKLKYGRALYGDFVQDVFDWTLDCVNVTRIVLREGGRVRYAEQ